MKNRYDVVVTNSTDELGKIIRPSESCQLTNGQTYTYVNSLNLSFTTAKKGAEDENQTGFFTYWIVILNNQRISPKSYTADLYLDVTITYDIKKSKKISKILWFFGRG